MSRLRAPAALALALLTAAPMLLVAPSGAASAPPTFEGYDLAPEDFCRLRDLWIDQILANHPAGTWAPLKTELTDEMLALMGLPSGEWLLSHRFPVPTMVMPDGTTEVVDLPAVDPLATGMSSSAASSFAGSGCFGIRPGSWVLLLSGGYISWCSLAHVYGSPGSYEVSTAGHCGNVGETATVIAAVGNRAGVAGVVLLDFGTFSKSTGDGGVGNDWALISVNSAYQHLVSPTMCFWGGPLGMYTKTGSTASVSFKGNSLIPTVSANPDPFLAQAIVHYGHGTGVGTAGTPRMGTAFHWGANHFMFEGAISPGDSGSGTNTLGGDSVGAVNEAAGINTHLYVDPLMRQGIGFMAGTRATLVQATLANGQIVPYPAPVPGAP